MVRVDAAGRRRESERRKKNGGSTMTVNEALRAMAGIVVLLTLALGYWVSPYWYLFTAFVGLNLLQSAFTRWCPAMAIFRKLGLKEG
jgi:hypothetical protein